MMPLRWPKFLKKLVTSFNSRRQQDRGVPKPLPEPLVIREMSEPSVVPPSAALGTWAHLLPILVTVFKKGIGPESTFPHKFQTSNCLPPAVFALSVSERCLVTLEKCL